MTHTINTNSSDFSVLSLPDKALLVAWIGIDEKVCSDIEQTLVIAKSKFLGKYDSCEDYAAQFINKLKADPSTPKYIKDNISIADVAHDFKISTKNHNGHYFGHYAITTGYQINNISREADQTA